MHKEPNSTQSKLKVLDDHSLNNDEEQAKPPKRTFLLLLSLLLVVAIAWYVVNGILNGSYEGTNSFFSACAFAGVVFAIFLQQKELTLQQQELRDTRKVLTKQQEQLEAHTKAFNKQNFENTFFKMLDLHHTMVNAISHDLDPDSLTLDQQKIKLHAQGRDCFEHFYLLLKKHHEQTIESGKAPIDRKVIDIAYGRLHNEFQASIGHYFRHLYNIVRYVDDSDVEDKDFYIRLLRSQLSVFELTLLFYNCLSPYGHKYFKPLVEKYTLLKTVEDKDLIAPLDRRHYQPTAFDKPLSNASTL